MFMRRDLKSDNRGIALISVMVCVMLSFLLSATIMRISLLSYLQKGVAKQASSTFYENEEFLDDIKMGVQQKVATAFASSLSTTSGTDGFVEYFENAMKAGAVTGDTEKQTIEKLLMSFINDSNANKVKSVTVGTDAAGHAIQRDGTDLVIRDVVIEYTDNTKDGYFSKIKTDIRIRSPYYTVTPGEPAITARYTVVAGGGTSAISGDGNDVLLEIYGSYYSGYLNGNNTGNTGYTTNADGTHTAQAAEVSNHTMLYFVESQAEKTERLAKKAEGKTVEPNEIIFNGDLYIKQNAKVVFLGGKVTVRGKIYIQGNGKLVVNKETTLIAQDIVIGSKSVATTSYNAPDSHKVNHLPYPYGPQYYKPQGDYADTSYNNIGSFFICTTPRDDIIIGTNKDDLKAEVIEASYSGGKIKDYGNIKLTAGGQYDSLKESVDPVTNIKKSDGNYYDAVFCSVVDVEWFLKGRSDGNIAPTASKIKSASSVAEYESKDKEPASATLLNKNGKKFYWKNTSNNSGETNGQGEDQNPHEIISGVRSRVIIGEHNGVLGTLNGTNNNFILTTMDVKFNDFNKSMDVGLIILSSKKVELPPKDKAIVKIVPLCDTLSTANYKKFIDQIGLHMTKKDASTYTQYNIVNNYFVGGIKTLYADATGSSTEVETEETREVTETDKDKNRSLDMVSFENWSKSVE